MIKKVFVVHHTHMDIGYTDLPQEVMDQHLGHLDQALQLCRQYDDFRWTIESAYLVRDYFRNRDERAGNDLIAALKSGRMELQAFETQPLTELLSADELFKCVGYACGLGQDNGFPVKCAMINDIGGYAGRLPSVLNACGVEYLTAGIGAFQVHLPWADLPHLFYLKAKDGARLLIWNLGIDRELEPSMMTDLMAVYGMGANFLINPAIKEYFNSSERGVEVDVKAENTSPSGVAQKFSELIDRLNRENYPYEEIMLQYGGDNRGPSELLVPAVRALNADGRMPEVEIVTPRCFFEYMQAKYDGVIPEVQGVVTDPWNMRANPAPTPLKKYRAAQRVYAAAESRIAMNDIKEIEYIDRLRAVVAENLQLYGDHTCGLSEWNWHESLDASDCRNIAYDRYRASWERKAFYADAAHDGAAKLARLVRNQSISEAAQGQPSIIIWNNASVETSGAAEVYLGRDANAINALCDKSGQPVPFQIIGANRYLIQVENIPAFGSEVLQVEFDEPQTLVPPKLPEVKAVPDSFLNRFMRVELDTCDGSIKSIIDAGSSREILDRKSKWKFGDFVYSVIDDVDLSAKHAGMKICNETRYPETIVTGAEVISDGPVAMVIRQKGVIAEAQNSIYADRDLILYYNQPRIDVKVRVSKPESAQKESCYVAFPFAGKNGSFRFDQNIGMVNTAEDLLPGAMQDMFYCSRFIAVNEDDFGAVICCPDAPILQLGAINTAKWLQQYPFAPETNHIYSHIYHNLLNTDCPLWQDIIDTFEYHVFISSGKFDYAAAQHNWGGAVLLTAAYANGAEMYGVPEADGEFKIEPECIRMLDWHKHSSGSTMRLENPLPETVDVMVSYNGETHNFSMKPCAIASVNL